MNAYVNTQAACTALQVIARKLFGYPLPGVRVGAGYHIDMVTTEHVLAFKHPTLVDWACPIDDTLIAGAVALRNRLSTAEQTTLDAAIAARVTLTSDWFPSAI